MKRVRNVAKGILLALSAGSLSGCALPSLLSLFGYGSYAPQPAYGVPYVEPTPGFAQVMYGAPMPYPTSIGRIYPEATKQLEYPVAIALSPNSTADAILNPTVADLVAGQCFNVSEQSLQALEASTSLLVKPTALCYDASGSLLVTDEGANALFRLENGQASLLLGEESLLKPQGVAVASDSILISDTGHHRILKLDAQGQVSVLAGNGVSGFADGTAAQFKSPTRLAVASDGTVYVADTGNHRIRKIALDGTVSTVAGTGIAGVNGDGSLAQNAQLNAPRGLALDGKGHLYVADTGNDRVRVIDLTQQEIETLYPSWVMSTAIFSRISDLAFANNALYVVGTDKSIVYLNIL